MMARTPRPARINAKAVFVLAAVLAVLAGGTVAGHYARKRIIASKALAEGQAAFEKQDWPAAIKHFKRYLSKYADNAEVLGKYARANVSVRPLEAKNIGAAIGAYRRLVRLRPGDTEAYERLAGLYTGIRNHGELAYIARKRLEQAPDDLKAPIWLGKALDAQQRPKEAREVFLKLAERLQEVPEKHIEYVEACLLLSRIAARDESAQAETEAKRWLDRAVAYDPNSSLALVYRARFYRASSDRGAPSREKALAAARADLKRAAGLNPRDPRIYLMLGEEWTALGDLDQAAAVLDKAWHVDPAEVEKHFFAPSDYLTARFVRMSEVLLGKGEIAEGVALADELLASHKEKPQRVRALPQVVRLYVAGNRVADARRYLDEYADAMRSRGPAAGAEERLTYLQALVAQAEDRPYRVIELLEPAVTRSGSDIALWQMLATAYRQTEQSAQAIRALRQGLRLEPRQRQMVMQLAREYFRQREWGSAAETARLAESLAPADLAAKLLRIESSIYAAENRRGATTRPQPTRWAKELAALRTSHPTSAEVRMLQAVIAQNQGRTDDAAKELKLAIDECTETLGAEMQLGRLYFSLGREDEAIEVYRAACKRHSGVATPWLGLSGLQRLNQDFKAARATLQAGLKAVANQSGRRRLLHSMAVLDLLRGERKSGLDLLKQMAAKDPQDVRVRSVLLNLPEVRSDRAQAQRLVDEIRRIQGDGGLLWRVHQASLWLSSSGWRAKQQDIAAALERCVDADPGWSTPALMLGRMYERLGDRDRAERVYRQVLSQRPTAIEVADRLVTLLQRAERFAEAKEVLDNLNATPEALSVRRVRLALGVGEFDRANEELKLRIAADPKDVGARVLLARLVYRRTRDAKAALRYLDEAAKIAPHSMAITVARVSILRAERRLEEAEQIVQAEVKRSGSFEAHLLRASYLASVGKTQLAEQAYRGLTAISKTGQGEEILGKFYADADRLDDAIAVWEKGAKAHPGNLSLNRRLMKALLERGRQADRSRAIEMLSSLEERHPDDRDLMWVRAVVLLDEGSVSSRSRAGRLLERVVQLDPTAVRAHLALIRLAMERRDYAAARDLAIRGHGANPKGRQLLIARARAEYKLNNPALAIRLARMALAQDPSDFDAANLLIEVAVSTRDAEALEQARAFLDESIKDRPDDGRLRSARAKVLAALGLTDAAIKGLEAYVRTEKGTRSAVALLTLAGMYRAKKDWATSDKLIEQASKQAPDSAQVALARVVWLGDQERYDEIASLMSSYRANKTSDPGVMFMAASILASSGPHIEQAMALLAHVTAVAPHLVDAQHGLAVLAYQTGDAKRAKQLCRNLLEANPNHVQVLNDLAWILAEADQAYEAALELADRGVSLAPADTHLRDTRGMILSHLPGRLKDARADFEKAVALTADDTPRRAKALVKLGRVCARLQDHAEAKRCLETALRIDQKRDVFSDKERTEITDLLRK